MLTEDQLKELVFDLGAARKGQLDENILHVFAAWIEYLLSKMYKGRRIPVKVRGNRIEVQRVFNHMPASVSRFYDPYAGTFDQRQLLDAFGFGNVPPAISFVLKPAI